MQCRSLCFLGLLALSVSGQFLKQSRIEVWHDAPERWDDDDLMTFVTRPDIRPPKWRVVQHDKERAEPGYLFMAPYSSFNRPYANSMWMPHQVGPHIYDQHGDLIWSGGHIYPGRAIFDFKVAMFNDEPHLTFAVGMGPERTIECQGTRMVFNSSYHLVANYTPSNGLHENMHEFTVLDNGRSALVVEHYAVTVENSATSENDTWSGLLLAQSVVELDMNTGEKFFDWGSHNHIVPAESSFPHPQEHAAGKVTHWDYQHMNSIDKTPSGDYLVSARHTNTIYLISRSSRDIIWRLGGRNSSFQMQGFDFNEDSRFIRQHDARVRSQNSTTTIVTLFNNACDESSLDDDDEPSSLLDVALYTSESPMVAKVIRRIPRPDRRRTFARGSYQHLPGGNLLGGWSDEGYTTEHTATAELVYEASFETARYSVYRTYKLPWIGRPQDKPVVKAFASATRYGELTTIMYVSWNGATEVARWTFYSADHGIFDVRRLGSAKRAGFETSLIVKGHFAIVFAEAFGRDGSRLANSTLQRTELPASWHIQDFEDDSDEFVPVLMAQTETEDAPHKLLKGFGLVCVVVVLLCMRRTTLQRGLRKLSTVFRRKASFEGADKESRSTQGKTSSIAMTGRISQR